MNEHPRAPRQLLDEAGGVDPIHNRHAQVHEDDIRKRFGGQLHRPEAIFRLGNDMYIRLLLQNGSNSVTQSCVVVC
jgi:hypothetical protein